MNKFYSNFFKVHKNIYGNFKKEKKFDSVTIKTSEILLKLNRSYLMRLFGSNILADSSKIFQKNYTNRIYCILAA